MKERELTNGTLHGAWTSWLHVVGTLFGWERSGLALLPPPASLIAAAKAAGCSLPGSCKIARIDLHSAPPLMQVKQLMAHQLAAEEELALLKKKTSGKHILEAKVHSKMRWVACVVLLWRGGGTGAQLHSRMRWGSGVGACGRGGKGPNCTAGSCHVGGRTVWP